MDLKESLLRKIYAYGFEKRSTIQQRVIKPCVDGVCDVSLPLVVIEFCQFIFVVVFYNVNCAQHV